MNKKELIERVAEEAGMSKAEVQKHFEAFTGTVTQALKGGEEIQITGFGKFEARERAAREGVNPQTGEKMHIAAKKVPGDGDYELARRRVREILAGDVARGSVSRPHEVVERLRSEWEIREDVGSTAMWEMVYDGYAKLSDATPPPGSIDHAPRTRSVLGAHRSRYAG